MNALPAEPSFHAIHLAADLERALDAEDLPGPEAASSGPVGTEMGAERRPDAFHDALPITRRHAPGELLQPAFVSGLVRMGLEEWGMIGALWTGLAFAPWWLYAPIAVLLAGRFHALGVILHDAAHMPLRRKTFAIHIVETLCGYPLATTLNAMRYHHLRHHRDSGMPQDPYFKARRQTGLWWFLNTARGLVLVPFWTLRAPFGATACLLPGLRNAYARVFLQDRSGEDRRHSREAADCARAEWGQLAAQAAVLAIIMTFPSQALWGYLVPVSLAGILAARRVILEHTHRPAPDRRIGTLIETTCDNHLGLWGALFLAPRNIGFHIVHHIHPQARLQDLPRLREWYRRTYPRSYPSPGRRSAA